MTLSHALSPGGPAITCFFCNNSNFVLTRPSFSSRHSGAAAVPVASDQSLTRTAMPCFFTS